MGVEWNAKIKYRGKQLQVFHMASNLEKQATSVVQIFMNETIRTKVVGDMFEERKIGESKISKFESLCNKTRWKRKNKGENIPKSWTFGKKYKNTPHDLWKDETMLKDQVKQETQLRFR